MAPDIPTPRPDICRNNTIRTDVNNEINWKIHFFHDLDMFFLALKLCRYIEKLNCLNFGLYTLVISIIRADTEAASGGFGRGERSGHREVAGFFLSTQKGLGSDAAKTLITY